MFERNEEKILKYSIGDKIMGYTENVAFHILIGGKIIEAKQSTSYLDDNKYLVRLEPDIIGDQGDKEVTAWLYEKDAQEFNEDIWKKSVVHWHEYLKLQKKAWLEFIRMHRSLRGEPDDISDEELERQIEIKGMGKERKKE